MSSLRLTGLLLTALVVGGCWPRYQYMAPRREAEFPGARGMAATYPALLAAWTRVEPLGLRSTASVTMFDPALGEAYLARHAEDEGREVGEGDRALWDGLYGARAQRLPFLVRWSFDKLFQPQRITQPAIGWRFELRDDHGRYWAPVAVDQVEQGETRSAWTGSFWVYFPTRELQAGPLFDGRTRKLTLRIAGEPGWSDFAWRFAPEPGALEEPWPDRR